MTVYVYTYVCYIALTNKAITIKLIPLRVEADVLARELVAAAGNLACYVPPFDDPLIWTGNASLVTELRTQWYLVTVNIYFNKISSSNFFFLLYLP